MNTFLKPLYLLHLLALAIGAEAQTLTTTFIAQLPPVVNETSGLALLDGQLLTHNDSGNPPELYLISPASGSLVRTISVTNAVNNDWEDLATDSTYLYVADIGNNYGERQNLNILRIPLDSLRVKNSVTAERIDFQYADQSSFSFNFFTNYDAEAFVAGQNEIFLFTKNRGNLRSNLYPIPKTIGNHSVSKTDSINSQGLITAACASADKQHLYLLGVDLSGPFLIRTDMGSQPGQFFDPVSTLRWDLAVQAAVQMEAIVHDGQSLWITTESTSGQAAALYQVNTISLNMWEEAGQAVRITPNPTNDEVFIDGLGSDVKAYELWNMERKIVREGVFIGSGLIDLFGLPSGMYILRIKGDKPSNHMILKT